MSERAEQLANILLEDDHDEHVKAHELVTKWDRAHATYLDLSKKRQKLNKLHNDLGVSIGLSRSLAHIGFKWDDVDHFIKGDQVGAVDNYKRETPALVCQNWHCRLQNRTQPEGSIDCPECREPLKTVLKRTPPSDLRTKFGSYWVGAELKDGRKVWFRDLVPPH